MTLTVDISTNFQVSLVAFIVISNCQPLCVFHSVEESIYTCLSVYTALLWQKEASHKSPKSEKVMFLDWTLIAYSTSIQSLEQKPILLKEI